MCFYLNAKLLVRVFGFEVTTSVLHLFVAGGAFRGGTYIYVTSMLNLWDEESNLYVTSMLHICDEEGTRNVTYMLNIWGEEGTRQVTYIFHILNEH